MNKKVIAIIVAILIIAVAGVVIYMVTGNNSETNNNSNNNQANDSAQNNNKNTDNNTTSNGGKALVLYFSMSGNTEVVANNIHDEVGGDIIKLETVENYLSDYNDLLDYAQDEQSENARPELSTTIDNIADYDVIFLGYPIWWGDMPMPIYTFLDNYDLSGKTIAPFVTSGGSGLSGTSSTIQSEESKATVTEGLSIRDDDARNSKSDVTAWLDSLGY